MSHDPRSSVRRGDPLAVSAEQINWINRQMRGGGGVAGALRMPPGLPQVRAKLPIRGHFGQVARLLGIGVARGALSLVEPLASQWVDVGEPPESPSTAWEYGEDEAHLPAYGRGTLGDASPADWPTSPEWSSAALPLNAAPSEPVLAVCTDNESHTWAVSGLAIARVRVFNRLHRYARMAMELPGSTSEENAGAAGCLDSAFYGPAKVLGYAYLSDDDVLGFRLDTTNAVPPVWPAFDLRWALVQF